MLVVRVLFVARIKFLSVYSPDFNQARKLLLKAQRILKKSRSSNL